MSFIERFIKVSRLQSVHHWRCQHISVNSVQNFTLYISSSLYSRVSDIILSESRVGFRTATRRVHV